MRCLQGQLGPQMRICNASINSSIVFHIYIYIHTHNICAYTHTFIDTCLYKIVGKWEWPKFTLAVASLCIPCLSSMLTEQLRTADIMLLYGSLLLANNILCNMNHGFYLYCGNIAL